MTTIVYDHKAKLIACDSRESSCGTIMSDSVEKWFYQGSDLYFYCGAVADIAAFKSAKKERGEKVEPNIDGGAIAVKNGIVYKCSFSEVDGYWELPLTFNTAIGSGEQWVIAALDHGKSIKEAVEYAMTRDACTGGAVRVFNLETMRFES